MQGKTFIYIDGMCAISTGVRLVNPLRIYEDKLLISLGMWKKEKRTICYSPVDDELYATTPKSDGTIKRIDLCLASMFTTMASQSEMDIDDSVHLLRDLYPDMTVEEQLRKLMSIHHAGIAPHDIHLFKFYTPECKEFIINDLVGKTQWELQLSRHEARLAKASN